MIYSNDFHWQSSFRLPQNVFGGLGLSYRCQCFLATNRLVKPSLIEVSMKWLNCLGLRREGSSLVLRPRRQGWGGPSEKSYFRRCDRNFLDWSENHLEFLGESRNRGQNPIRTKSSARDAKICSEHFQSWQRKCREQNTPDCQNSFSTLSHGSKMVW